MTKKLKWCCKQKHGIELVEPNKNLADAYIQKAGRSLEELRNAKYKETKISFAYYVMYESVYSILQIIGIKSEIHTCTFELMKVFLSEHFNEKDYSFCDGILHSIDCSDFRNCYPCPRSVFDYPGRDRRQFGRRHCSGAAGHLCREHQLQWV